MTDAIALLWTYPEHSRRIQPLRGIRSKTQWYQILYDVIGSSYPVLRRVLPRYVTTTVNIGRAMIAVVSSGYPTQILFSPDINRLAAIPEV